VEIKSQKDLEKLIRMLRKQGVEAIKIDNIELHLGKMPLKASSRPKAMSYSAPEESIKVPQFNGITTTEASDSVETDELSEEELLFYSATGEAQ
jgi:CO dehydrogenase/acetyl-CoA synthase delta subunit